MNLKKDLIDKIVAKEWDMFQTVANVSGRAACQDNFETFSIMRSSQANGWSEAALSSYLDDLTDAQENGRNLLTEKYARGSVQLRYDNPFGTIDDKSTPWSHIRDSPQIDILNNRIKILMIRICTVKFEFSLKRHTVCQTSVETLLY